MEKLILDRFEGDYAVCEREDGTLTDVLRTLLPADAAEGDCLLLDDDGSLTADPEATESRRSSAARRMRRLFGD